MTVGITPAGQAALLDHLGACAVVEEAHAELTGRTTGLTDPDGGVILAFPETTTIWREIPGTRHAPIRDGLTWTADREATVRWCIRYTRDPASWIVTESRNVCPGDDFTLTMGSSPTPTAPGATAEQEARDLLDRMGIPGAQSLTQGDVAELADLIADRRRLERDLATAQARAEDLSEDLHALALGDDL